MKIVSSILFALTSLTITACGDMKSNTELSANGVWEQSGYGKIIQIDNDTVRIHDVTKIGCNLHTEELLSEMGKIDSFDKDTLTIRKNIKTYRYSRLKVLPVFCENADLTKANPILNFETVWNTFNENYAYFEERNVDWSATYKKYRAQVNENTNDVDLYLVVDEMLSSLNDGHVNLSVSDELEEKIDRLENEQSKQSDNDKQKISKFDLGIKVQGNITKHYCADTKQHNAGIVKWCMMKGDIAYVQINAMLFLAYYDLPTGLSLKETWPHYWAAAEKRPFQRQDEINGANKLMGLIVEDLNDAKAYVLDLRFNIGGKDEAALGIVGHFAGERLKIATKKAKLGAGFTNYQDIILEPKVPNFLGNVYFLTSHDTASSAELATLATLPYKNFTRIGSNTQGVFSDGLDKKLPNGWEYTLSNEVYEDTKGQNYESVGVPADVKLDYPKDSRAFYNAILEQLSKDGDLAIETAIALQNKGL